MSIKRRVIVTLRPGSDGDASHVPTSGNKTQVNPPNLYLEKIGQQWMEARGEATPGVEYVLQSLPLGYTMWQRPRPSNPRHIDKYLYGHPQGRVFDSPNRYFPHFAFLMENAGSSMGCQCTVCAGSGGVLPKTSSSKIPSNSAKMRSSSTASSRPSTPRVSKPASFSSQFAQMHASAFAPPVPVPVSALSQQAPTVSALSKGRPKLVSAGIDSSQIDEEGTPDVYRNLINKLRRQNTIDEVIEEPLSPDWRAEQEILPSLLQSLKQQEQWIPRVGDIVLYLRDLPNGVEFVQNEDDGLQLYDEEAGEFLGVPPWEAGLVGEAPSEKTTIANLYQGDRETNVIYSGVRVEPLPDPNASDKSLSKRHKYVSLRQTRPLVVWNELLRQVPQEHWHPTVMNALTVASTLSLVGRYRFRGTWPNAVVYCHGLHLGSEMLAVGDTVRLLPSVNKNQSRCVEILVIKTIRLKWSNLDKASKNDYDEGRPYNSEVWVYGSAYTNDPMYMNKEYFSEGNVEPPKAADAYGEWYPLHPASKELAVPYSRVVGRLHEREAMSFWLSKSEDPPGLDVGRDGLIEARIFSRKHDQRIARELGATWFWGDTRADALNLQTINGLETTKYDQQRDIRDLRKNVKVIDAVRNNELNVVAKPTMLLPLRSFMAPGTESLPNQTNRVRGTSMSGSATGSSCHGGSSRYSKKRPHTVELSDEEDEDEIQTHTKIVEDGSSMVGIKKAKVMVVIK
jgi:hypothetical protein